MFHPRQILRKDLISYITHRFYAYVRTREWKKENCGAPSLIVHGENKQNNDNRLRTAVRRKVGGAAREKAASFNDDL
jgi:hypothetical protein